jgi:glycerol-3-phosphate dehydrogenase
VIVGTTDSPANKNPEEAQVTSADVNYLMNLLKKYFPQLNISNDDILSAYVGVRPLMGNAENKVHAEESARAENLSPSLEGSHILQKVSREHHIDRGPGGTVVVAGGKYTTHRKMAEEIVDYTLKIWKEDRRKKPELPFPEKLKRPQTKAPVNPDATPAAIQQCREVAAREGIQIPEELVSRYGAQSLDIWSGCTRSPTDPPGFPCLSAQLRHSIRTEMVLHLEDFYLRRVALYASRKDHGLPWAKELAQVWAEERGLDSTEIQPELERLQTELKKRSSWQQKLDDPC